MASRLIALLLAVVLFWSGLSTFETPSAHALPSPDRQHVIATAGGPAALNDGSVEDHHLDDQPAQAQSDPSTEMPSLVTVSTAPVAPSLMTVTPRTFVSRVAGPPYLTGPMRPPCCQTFAG